jgi:uncharacterized membrane protein
VNSDSRLVRAEPRRFWEIDTIRGIAIVNMIFFHLVFDLYYFGAYTGYLLGGGWQTYARSIGGTFIFLLGVSLTLRYNKLSQRLDGWPLFLKFLQRGAWIFFWGLVVTVVTYFFVGRAFVIFGILHLLGLSTVLAYPFLRSRWAALVTGVVVIVLGLYIRENVALSPWLLWLAMKTGTRFMVDHYPLLPWFGFALLGVFAGHTLYPGREPSFVLPDLSRNPLFRGLTFLGRHSLVIYLVHQPLLIGILLVAGIAQI